MEEDQEKAALRIAALSHKELADELKALNEIIGPVTGATRKLYEKKLVKRLCGSAEVKISNENCNNSNTAQEVPSESDCPASKSIFYGILIDPLDQTDSSKCNYCLPGFLSSHAY
jgi:hypothetical protein